MFKKTNSLFLKYAYKNFMIRQVDNFCIKTATYSVGFTFT